jgi:hypothetical protein
MKVVHHYDFIGYLKQDSRHTQSAWEFFLKEYHLYRFTGEIYIWADTAFRKKSDLSYFRTKATEMKIQITCHFFAPYHGHSICDQHFGHGKQKLRRQNLGSPVTSLQQIQESFGSYCKHNNLLIGKFQL